MGLNPNATPFYPVISPLIETVLIQMPESYPKISSGTEECLCESVVISEGPKAIDVSTPDITDISIDLMQNQLLNPVTSPFIPLFCDPSLSESHDLGTDECLGELMGLSEGPEILDISTPDITNISDNLVQDVQLNPLATPFIPLFPDLSLSESCDSQPRVNTSINDSSGPV